MKKIYYVLLLVLCGCTHTKQETKINLSSVDQFLAIADSIAHGQEVIEETWDTLIHSDGYVMAGWDKHKDLVRSAMLIAFHPDSTTFKDSLLGSNPDLNDPMFHTTLIVRNYADMRQHWEEIKRFRAEYDYGRIEQEAMRIVKEFLPNVVDSLLSFPNVGFVCGDPECRSKSSGISLDMNVFYRRPEEGIKVLAHEMFHSYREYFEDWDRNKEISALIALNALQNEGIADLIDKPADYDPIAYFTEFGYPATIAQEYLDAVASTSEKMEQFDSLTVAYEHQLMSRKEYVSQMEAIFPLGAHPNGRYLTSLMVAHGLKERLLAHFASPEEFIVLYNEIAASEDLHVMSDEFMQIVRKNK